VAQALARYTGRIKAQAGRFQLLGLAAGFFYSCRNFSNQFNFKSKAYLPGLQEWKIIA